MNILKEFIYRLRNFTLQEVYLVIHNDKLSQKLKECIKGLINVKLQDGVYHTYYADVKKHVANFMNFYNQTIDEIIAKADKYKNTLNKDDLIDLVENTLAFNEVNQIDFGKEFLPIKSLLEKQIYEEIEEKYFSFKQKIYELKAQLQKLDKIEKIEQFAQSGHFDVSIRATNEIFRSVHLFIGMFLANYLYQIRVSLEEILLRMRNNYDQMLEEDEEKLNQLHHNLYDKNKEQLMNNRSLKRSSLETAEISRSIEIMRVKVENFEHSPHLTHLEEEVKYWEGRLKDFREVSELLTKLKRDVDVITKQEEIYNKMRTNESPGPKFECWENMGCNFKEQKQTLNDKMADAARALVTFFCCRGTDRIFYADNIGMYYMDEFNHQVYSFECNAENYHVDCYGNLKEIPETPYYFDEIGRYTLQNGEKMYQCAPCTSEYKLAENALLKKVTKDCGHSERMNENCMLEVKSCNFQAVLPEIMTDIKNTLPSEVVGYLWKCFGGILPKALRDVAVSKPVNPIHMLAHKLVYYKCNSTPEELVTEAQEAESYRTAIYKRRQDAALAANKCWKSKQVRRRKPEESDDADHQAVIRAQEMEKQFIHSLDYFN